MSINVSKKKRDDLIKKIKEIRIFIAKAEQDENAKNLLGYLSELEKELKGKKYGLVFEEHREAIDDIMDTHTPVLTEDKDLFIDSDGTMNFLIEGDNLPALKLLEKTHKGKIDVIYIDPPYNTGNKDFVYDDTFINSTDTFKHSKWISFLAPRLKSARQMLSQNGLCFISINDIEHASLKLLCDEIFNENNFIANLVWANQEGGGSSDSKLFRIKHEYILCYCKDITNINIVGVDINNIKRYKKSDQYEPQRGKYYLQKLGMGSIQYSDTLDYPIQMPDDSFITPAENNSGKKACWRWSKKKFEWGQENGFIEIKKDSKGIWTVYTKQYLKCDNNGNIIERTQRPIGVINEFSSTQGSKSLIKLFEKPNFSYPKDPSLVKWLIERASKNNELIILDFFAGSGTTGHAVLEMNKEDQGKRQFILVTNNENNICREITYERIKRVIEKEDYNASLKYYKVDFVPIDEQLYYEYADQLLLHVRELVELENGINFIGNAKIAIVLTDEELKAFIKNIDTFKKCKTLYLGHDVLTDGEQEALLKEHKIKVNVIPDYYYRELEG